MMLICPCCAARFDIEAAINDETARQAIALALAAPRELKRVLPAYLGLFRPRERQLSWSRFEKLLRELLEMIEAGQIERKGRSWAAPVEHWRLGMDQMIEGRERLTLPLKTHGYLLEIIAGMVDKTEAKAEAARESGLRRRDPAAAPSTVSPEVAKQLLEEMKGLFKPRRKPTAEATRTPLSTADLERQLDQRRRDRLAPKAEETLHERPPPDDE